MSIGGWGKGRIVGAAKGNRLNDAVCYQKLYNCGEKPDNNDKNIEVEETKLTEVEKRLVTETWYAGKSRSNPEFVHSKNPWTFTKDY